MDGDIWNYFDYLDRECLISLAKALVKYDSTKFKLERIIKATPNSKTNFDKINPNLNELGLEIYRTFGQSEQSNFAVFKSPIQHKELYTLMTFNHSTHKIIFKGISNDTSFALKIDSSFITSNCFKHRLKLE